MYHYLTSLMLIIIVVGTEIAGIIIGMTVILKYYEGGIINIMLINSVI